MFAETRLKGATARALPALQIPMPRSSCSDPSKEAGTMVSEGPANSDQSVQPHDRHAGTDNPTRPATRSHNTTSTSKTSPVAANGPQKQNNSPSLGGGVPAQFEPRSPIDPLSHHILTRTNTDKSLSRLRTQPHADSEPPAAAEGRRSLARDDSGAGGRADSILGHQKSVKDKKKGVSFLSRFISTKRRDSGLEPSDDVSEVGERRAAGMDAEVFAQPIGFMPRYPPPPKYIKVRSHNKKDKDFNRLFVAQELRGRAEKRRPSLEKSSGSNATESDGQDNTGKAVWVLKFSKDGKYLAAAGQDRKVRVWAVIATPEDRHAHEIEEEARSDQPSIRLSAPVFKSKPLQEFEGHTGSIVDISWSKNNFLLSTSMDKTVRLWHITRNECLCVFKHSDFVTSIEFHPRDDRFFLAGSLDSKLRLWSIPDKSVAFIANLPDMITAVAFTPDGKHSIAGCLNGLCLVFHTDGLKAQSQIHVRSARGRNAKGSKITGIDTIAHPPESDNVKLLITSNDSRIRLYSFRDRTLDAKFRGNENANSQIRASFSNDGRYIICGSEDHRAYIWPLTHALRDADKRPVETFEAHGSIVTTAIFAPISTKQVLGSTGDLLYDLCNPPPVTLVSQAPSIISKPPAEDEGPGDSTPRTSTRANNHSKVEESPAYLERSKHSGGNIIVTADFSGSIKVFRQDCGYHKRLHESWDRNSTFSRKLLGRASSVSTRRSIASSIGKESKTPSDRILSWRSGVVRHHDNLSVDNIRSNASQRTRSPSPPKSLRRGSPTRPSDLARPAAAGASRPARKPSANLSSSAAHPTNGKVRNGQPVSTEEQESNPLWLAGDQSLMFWNTARVHAARAASGNRRASLLSLEHSDISPISSDMGGEGEHGEGEGNVEADEVEELSCRRCTGTNFRATRTRHGDQRLICIKCGTAAAT